MAGPLDLPLPLLGLIVAHLHSIADIFSVRCSCRGLRAASREAPLSLRVESFGAIVPGLNEVLLQDMLNDVVRTLNNVVGLDLRGCPVTDAEIHLLQGLGELRFLNLASCQKLTLATVQALTWGHSAPMLESLNLQRCFRLTDSVAGNRLPLLELLTGTGSTRRLRCLLLSHIPSLESLEPVLNTLHNEEKGSGVLAPLSQGYQQSVGSLTTLVESSPNSHQVCVRGLTVLALHNCGLVRFKHLLALAAACSGLETLCLGGSVVACQDGEDVVEAFAGMQRLQLLELTFWDGRGACASGQASQPPQQSLVAHVRAALSAMQQGLPVRVWDFCNTVDNEAACLWFLQQASAHEKSALSAAANCSDRCRCTPLHVAASRGDVASVISLLAIGAAAGGEGSVPGGGPRDVGGATALFLAAENGHAHCVEALARGGADVLASNRGNESPLYIAALKGHLDVVEVLLRHCCERGLKWQDAGVYGDGWTPLMAAAVANRQDVAILLLQTACAECASEVPPLLSPGLPSQFISSTVLSRGNHQQTSGTNHNQSPSAAPIRADVDLSSQPPRPKDGSVPLLDAQNKYGSTALHISAMKSLSWFVLNLLRAGADWRIEDTYGLTARQVAAKSKHKDVEQILLKWSNESMGKIEGANHALQGRWKGHRKQRRPCGNSHQNRGGQPAYGDRLQSMAG